MKKLLLILLCLPFMTLAQQNLTFVPDDSLEFYLEYNGMGNGIPYDDYVTTSNIYTVTSLNVSNRGIHNLRGIEDFYALTWLDCHNNDIIFPLDLSNNTFLTTLDCHGNNIPTLDVSANALLHTLKCGDNHITSLDVSQSPSLDTLVCYVNNLTSLDVSNNMNLSYLNFALNGVTSIDVSNNDSLEFLICIANQLTSLDLSNNPALEFLACGNNQLTSLDVSNNPSLKYLECGNDTTSFPFQNTLISLDLRNGNNTTFIGIISTNNPNLYCIDVDNANWSTTNWIGVNFNFDPQHYFSNNCSGTAIEEHTTHRELLRTIDVLGRETKNQPLFYIYNDGTVEKRIIIE